MNTGRDSSVLYGAEGGSSPDEPEHVFGKPIEVTAEEQSITTSKKVKAFAQETFYDFCFCRLKSSRA